jgi:hypothetical protein
MRVGDARRTSTSSCYSAERKRAVVGEIENSLRSQKLSFQHRQLVIRFETDSEVSPPAEIPVRKLAFDISLTGGTHQGRHPIQQRNDVVGDWKSIFLNQQRVFILDAFASSSPSLSV